MKIDIYRKHKTMDFVDEHPDLGDAGVTYEMVAKKLRILLETRISENNVSEKNVSDIKEGTSNLNNSPTCNEEAKFSTLAKSPCSNEVSHLAENPTLKEEKKYSSSCHCISELDLLRNEIKDIKQILLGLVTQGNFQRLTFYLFIYRNV